MRAGLYLWSRSRPPGRGWVRLAVLEGHGWSNVLWWKADG